MATMTITIPDAQLNRVRDAFAAAYGYSATVPDPANPGQTIPNPENKTQFTQRMVRKYMHEVVKGYEATKDAETARQAAIIKAENEVTLS